MNRRQYKKQLSYRTGYVDGYYYRSIRAFKRNDSNYMRGFRNGRQDRKDRETPEYEK